MMNLTVGLFFFLLAHSLCAYFVDEIGRALRYWLGAAIAFVGALVAALVFELAPPLPVATLHGAAFGVAALASGTLALGASYAADKGSARASMAYGAAAVVSFVATLMIGAPRGAVDAAAAVPAALVALRRRLARSGAAAVGEVDPYDIAAAVGTDDAARAYVAACIGAALTDDAVEHYPIWDGVTVDGAVVTVTLHHGYECGVQDTPWYDAEAAFIAASAANGDYDDDGIAAAWSDAQRALVVTVTDATDELEYVLTGTSPLYGENLAEVLRWDDFHGGDFRWFLYDAVVASVEADPTLYADAEASFAYAVLAQHDAAVAARAMNAALYDTLIQSPSDPVVDIEAFGAAAAGDVDGDGIVAAGRIAAALHDAARRMPHGDDSIPYSPPGTRDFEFITVAEAVAVALSEFSTGDADADASVAAEWIGQKLGYDDIVAGVAAYVFD